MFTTTKNKNEKYNSRLQKQLDIAKHGPSDVLDLSSCQLRFIPDGIFALIKVLLKKTVLLHSNSLLTLKEGRSYEELEKASAVIRVLDLHGNKLVELPPKLGYFVNLQVLNLMHNDLRELPASIGDLCCLRDLNLSKNRFERLPIEIGKLSRLRSLDISSNFIRRLPDEVSSNTSLEILVLDVQFMEYPDSATCSNGASAVISFLCEKQSIPYIKTKVSSDETFLSEDRSCPFAAPATSQQLLLRQELLDFDRKQSSLFAHLIVKRKQLLEVVSSENAAVDKELFDLQKKKEAERISLLQTQLELENNSNNMIQELLNLNEHALKVADIRENEERQRIKDICALERTAEERSIQRSIEAKKAMEDVLMHTYDLEQLRALHEASKSQTIGRHLQEDEGEQYKIQLVLNSRVDEAKRLVEKLLKDDVYQREAVEMLLAQNDAKTMRINDELRLLEAELAQLSQIELRTRQQKMQFELEQFELRRVELMKLFDQLLVERKLRSMQLKEIMIQIENEKTQCEENFWLNQYQRLLSLKPRTITKTESCMDSEVTNLLCHCKLDAYIPLFASQKLTSLNSLTFLSDADLRKIGISEPHCRKLLLNEIQAAICKATGSQKHRGAASPLPVDGGELQQPCVSSTHSLLTASTRPLRAHFEESCVICMEKQCVILFIPCGHVCSCEACASAVKTCPLCRMSIESTVNISANA